MAAVTADVPLHSLFGANDDDPSAPDPLPPNANEPTGPTRDDLDDLFDYDRQIGDVFRDVDPVTSNQNITANSAAVNATIRPSIEERGDLGIDEEVTVRKARRPVAKLDEERLLGEKGIPKLRKITKDRLKFKGKGHEFSDMGRLLATYQFWLDDMFPKAKFADGLAIIEKLGHSKRMKVMRKAWIEEDKPKLPDPENSDGDAEFVDAAGVDQAAQLNAGEQAGHSQESDEGIDQRRRADSNDLYAEPTPALEQRGEIATRQAVQSSSTHEDHPEPDELDELLAEDEAAAKLPETENASNLPNDNFADEEEAMAAMDENW